MDLSLSQESRRFIADEVAAGRYSSEDAVIEDAISRMREQGHRPRAGLDPIAGMFADDPGLIDEVVEEAMKAREGRPWRLPPGE